MPSWIMYQTNRDDLHRTPEQRLRAVLAEHATHYPAATLVLCRREAVAKIAGVTVREREAGEPVCHSEHVYFIGLAS